MKVAWRIEVDGAPVVVLPCGHEVLIKPEWVRSDGRFMGRLACTVDGCRKVIDVADLEGWSENGL